MIHSSRVSGLLKILVALAVFGWSLSYLGFSTDYKQVLRHFKGEKARFVEDFLKSEEPFDGGAIESFCASRNWTRGLMFECEPAPGGIGEVRNGHLNCIRFAMEAGAELVIPEIVRRSDLDIAVVAPNTKGIARGVSLDYYFDKQYLNWTLSTFCPQMKLHWSIDDLWDTPMGNPITVYASSLGLNMVNGTVFESPGKWATAFQRYFNLKSNPKIRTWPFKIILSQGLYVWPTSYDDSSFVRNFGRILRLRKDTKLLAAAAMHSMGKKLLKPHGQPDSGSPGQKGFVGVHLRTEKDVWAARFPSYDEQAAYYLDYIVKSPFRNAYLASGATPENITAFTERARDFNITVVTKKDLLEPDESHYLASLSWDQQALVDFEVLLRADLMAGISESSFAWSVALKRAASAGSIGGGTPSSELEHIRWTDSLSAIMGRQANQNLNMQYSIWP